ncbi:hypothetical protein KR093_007316 [Drosophila rubida]|uniref:Uncharacterized protein n=1 Tax=Drosophila rubida TaxID=30044 RepID=A0AAD4KAN9_9MUSC|nr:hypothetical protein KR093_007316 [Drosophila rubida]
MSSKKSLKNEENTNAEQIEVVEEIASSFSSLSNISPTVSSSSTDITSSSAVAALTPPRAQESHLPLRVSHLNKVRPPARQPKINQWLEFVQLEEEPPVASHRLSSQNLTPIAQIDKQKVLTEWLRSVETPAVGSDELPQAASAPLNAAAAAAVDCVEQPAMPLSVIPVMRTVSNSNANIPRFNIERNSQSQPKAPPLSGAEKRSHERRKRREQLSPVTSLSRTLPSQTKQTNDDDASFFQELLDSMENSNTQMPTSQSIDNNMKIYNSQPSPTTAAVKTVDKQDDLRASCQSFNLAASLSKPSDRVESITQYRRRMRSERSLKSDTVLEMLSLPSQPPQQPPTPIAELSFMDIMSPIREDETNQSQSLSESDFRVPNLPQDSQPAMHDSMWDCAPIEMSGVSMPTGETSAAPSLDFTVAQGASMPLLDMIETEETQESVFELDPPNANNWLPSVAQPRDTMFEKDNAKHLNIEVDLKFMPPSIQKLYALITGKFSDYAFVYTLSAQLGQECVPMECYVYLKMALLISLVSIELDELRPPIPLCVICNDCCATHRLLSSIGQLAPRFIGPHEGGQQFTFNALPARYNWVQATPLMMAQQGVYYAGDWNRLTRDQAEELEKAIENNTLRVPQVQSEAPLEAAIWTFWQPENAVNQTTAFAKLCPIFGLPIYVDEPVNSSMWNFVLHEHSRDAQKKPDTIRIPNEDMRMLLELIQQRQVVFGEPAERLLKRYYVVSRARQSTAFSSKTYIVLKQFAESLAKLAMRLDVIESDVVAAIFHCEHFVRSVFGAGDFPPPAVVSFNVVSRVDPYMNEFTRWLFQYLERYEQQTNEPLN